MGTVQRQQQFLSYRHSSEFDVRGYRYGMQDNDQVSSDHWVDFADCPGVAEVELGEFVGGAYVLGLLGS